MVQYTEICQHNLLYKKTQRKNHMVISLDAKKVFDKIEFPLILKVLERSGIQGTYLNLMKAPANE